MERGCILGMRPLRELLQAESFKLYRNSHEHPIGFSELYVNLSLKEHQGHKGIIVEKHTDDWIDSYMYINGSLQHVLYIHDDDEDIFPDSYNILKFTKDSTDATYYIIGYWTGKIS